MRFFGIIPYKVVHQATIENIRVIQTISIPIYKLFLTGPVESLNMPIGLRMIGIIKEVDKSVIKTRLSKVFYQHSPKRYNIWTLPSDLTLNHYG